jgi:hypothetical protein
MRCLLRPRHPICIVRRLGAGDRPSQEDPNLSAALSEYPVKLIAQLHQILRKEVIQPQVPLRLPCYDFTPVADPTVIGCVPCGFAHRLKVEPTPMV